MKNRLRVEVRATVAKKVRPLLPRFRRLFGRAARFAGVKGREISFLFTDDAEMRVINRQFANEDHATDVLSFAQDEGETPRRGSQPRPLGDIVFALPTAERQAREKGHPLLAELFHLGVHGLCHLLGYDHADPAAERVMFGYESEIRRRARSARSLPPVKRPPR